MGIQILKDREIVSSGVAPSEKLPPSYQGAVLECRLEITRAPRNRSLEVQIQYSLDGDNWEVIGSFPRRSSPGHYVMTVNLLARPKADRVRCSWSVSGTDATSTPFAINVSLETAPESQQRFFPKLTPQRKDPVFDSGATVPTFDGAATVPAFEIIFDDAVSAKSVIQVLSALADYYRACGGLGLEIEFDIEDSYLGARARASA